MANSAIPAEFVTSTTNGTTSSRDTSRWWQWVLVYPTLAVTLITAVPTWIDHIRAAGLGVSRGDLAQAQEQNQLWQVNLDCARSQEIQRIKTKRNLEIGAQVCPSGDVLLLLKRPEADQPTFRWVSARTLEREASVLLGPTAAYAEPREGLVAQVPRSVINQRWLKPGLLKQRVQQAGGGCVDLVINTYTGRVSQTLVRCDAEF